ncbi:MAG TPA: FimV/HubP family polar landmark protein, partial [Xanthomonadaceae bacterium]|nr:FimV/HubP family polar landmark protein [Xanthomonadaceae bacterium]
QPAQRAPAPAPAPVAEPPPAPVPEPEPSPPPVQTVAEPAPVEPAVVAPEPTPAPAFEPLPAPPAPAPTPTPTAPVGEYGPVASGETLWSIAQRTRPDAGISVNQMMIALQQANPEAFIGENINRLKRGAVLRIPDSTELAALSASQAAVLVREQMDAWRGESRPQPQPAEPEPEAVAAQPAPVRREDARLELVAPRSETASPESARSGADTESEAGAELRAELARAQEEVVARDQEIGELQSRVAELEALQTDNARLLEMKDSELAVLQRRLAELEAERVAAQAQAGEAGPDADAETGAAPVEDEAVALEPEAPAEEAAEEVSATAPAAEQAPATQPAPAGARTLPWYRNIWFIVGAGLVLLGLLALLLRRRGGSEPRRPRSLGESTLADSFARPAAATVVAPKAAPPAQDLQAEREAELVDALAEHPEDLDRHLELARFYYEEGDVDAFEGVAEAMNAQVDDPDSLEWRQVVAMGRELLPDHPLFAVPEPPEPIEEAAWQAPDPEAPDTGVTGRHEIDWDTATPVVPAPEPAADAGTTQRFRIENLEAVPAEPSAGRPETELPAPEAGSEPAEAPEPAATEYDFGGTDDAAATKLELARAYLDMGDIEGARGMLEEVVNEGNAGQRDEARRLLDEIR